MPAVRHPYEFASVPNSFCISAEAARIIDNDRTIACEMRDAFTRLLIQLDEIERTRGRMETIYPVSGWDVETVRSVINDMMPTMKHISKINAAAMELARQRALDC